MKRSCMHHLLWTAAALWIVAAAPAFAQPAGEAKTAATQAKDQKDTYPLDTCPVTGAKLGEMGKPYVHEYKGREIRFCCKGCVKKFEADPEKYLKQMDEAIITKQKGNYPLESCVVSGGKLEAGKTYDYVYKNTLVRFCCKDCVEKFQKDPEKYMKQIEKARQEKADKKAGEAKP